MISSAASPTPKVNLTPQLPHADAAAAARGGDALGGTAGDVHTEVLPNGVRMVIADRPGASSVKLQLGVGAGSNQDPTGKLGMAHLIEHLSFEGSPTRSAAEQEKLRIGMGNNWNAYTDTNSIVFYGIVPNKDAKTAASLITDMFKHPAQTGKRVPQELAAVKNEMIFGDGSIAGDLWNVQQRLVYGDTPQTNNVIGTRKTVDKITTKDMRTFHDAYFTGRNTVALVEGDARHLPLDVLRKELGSLEPGARVGHEDETVDFVPGKAIQVVKDPAHGAVDLSLTIPVDEATFNSLDPTRGRLVTLAMSNELNNKLRRFDHLTYGASAQLQPSADIAGKGAMLVLQASVASSVVKQAAEDLVKIARDSRDGFGAVALRRDKQQYAANVRMAEPDMTRVGVSDAAEGVFQTALTDAGISADAPPAPRSERAQKAAFEKKIRSVGATTQAQFAKTASQLVNLDNVKVLAYGDVDATELRAGLKAGGLDLAGVKSNPVDLSTYKDMGLGLPKQD
jgi:predicted Zn-dependent peptidase